MYEKWKDLYGSEVNRRLDELKSQLQHIEKSIEDTRSRIEPYVRDVVMINELGDNQHLMNNYYQWKGYASMIRQLKFVCYKGLKNEHGKLYPVDDEEEATHYRVMHIMGHHVVQAQADQPNQPGGSSTGVIWWRPAIVCKHVFENFFRPKIDHAENMAEEMVEAHVGTFNPKPKALEYKSARQEKDMSVRDLRMKVQEELGESVPIEFSSKIRRIEDGLDSPESVKDKHSQEYFDALNKILEIEPDESESSSQMYSGLEREMKKFVGKTDEFYVENGGMRDFITEFRFDFYFDWKIGLGLYTMK